jgi:hypothetical protein
VTERALVAALLVALCAPAVAASDPPAVVPFTFSDGHIFVDAAVDGHGPYRFAIDTGAGDTLAADVAATLRLRTGRPFTIGGTGEGTIEARSARLASLRVGSAEIDDSAATVFGFDELRNVEGIANFDGLIGHELFERYVVRIDYAAQTVTLSDPATYVPGPGIVVPFTLAGTTPVVEGSVDGIPGRFTIDTGDRGALSLTRPFVAAHHLEKRYSPAVEAIAGWGIGGPLRAVLTRVGELRFGTIAIERPVTRLTEARHGFFTSTELAGNIGNGVLERFTVTFDYRRREMSFEPRRAAPDYVADRSGMWVIRTNAGVAVVDVASGTPAAQAGVSAGDVIVRVDGDPASDLSLADLRARFRGDPGTVVVLRIKRTGTERDATVVLRDLL